MKTYDLPGSVRSKKNSKRACMVGGKHVRRRAVILPSNAYQAWEKAARQAAQTQGPYGPGMEGEPVEVQVLAYIRGVIPDLSGVLESVGDALEGIAWYEDKQIVSWDGSRVMRDKDNPRTVVIVQQAMIDVKN